MATANGKRRINSISVGFRLIDILAASAQPRTLTEVSRLAGMPTSQAQLYMNSFVAEGLVEQDRATLKYKLGPFSLQLGMSALNSLEPTELAHKKLLELTDATQKSGHVSIWGKDGPIVISKVDQLRSTPLTIRIGHVLPVLNSATGRVFWANLHRDMTQSIVRQELRRQSTAGALAGVDLDAIKADILQRRVAFTSDLHNVGFAALAAPVFDHTGAPVCSITIMGPRRDFEGPQREQMSDGLVASADLVSQHLGWTPPTRQATGSSK